MQARGFTLIELLVVIAIIGILASFGLANFTSAQAKARDAQRKNDLDQMRKALELYRNDSQGSAFYPRSVTPLESSGYIKKIPTDPRSGSYYYNISGDCSGPGSICTNYILCATLENTNDPAIRSGTPNYSPCPAGGVGNYGFQAP